MNPALDDPLVEAQLIAAVWSFIDSGALRVVTPGVEHFDLGTISDEQLRELSVKHGADPEAVVRIKHQHGEQRAAQPADAALVVRRLSEWARERPELPETQLVTYWQTEWCQTRNDPPFALTSDDAHQTGLWPSEVVEYQRIVDKNYHALTPQDLVWVVSEAELFLPARQLRYFLPALTEHLHQVVACQSSALPTSSNLVNTIRKAQPLAHPSLLSAALARAITARVVGPIDLHRSDGWPAMMALLFELDTSSLHYQLLESDDPSIAITVAQYVDVIVAGNLPIPPTLSLDRVLATLERIAALPDPDASLYARVVLGHADREELASCRDPGCARHQRHHPKR